MYSKGAGKLRFKNPGVSSMDISWGAWGEFHKYTSIMEFKAIIVDVK